jgi:hypothetical protein
VAVIPKLSDAELYEIIERGADPDRRAAARAELELRSYQRSRRVMDRQLKIAWLVVAAACASAVAAIAIVIAELLRG